MRNRWPWGAFLVTTLFSTLGEAQPQRYGVGFYAPEISLDPYKCFSYTRSLANKLGSILNAPVKGILYKSARDFDRNRRAKRIQFAVLGGFYLASSRPGQILATAKLADRRLSMWTIMSKQRLTLGDLHRRTLQLPRVGNLVAGLVQNGLLGGNLRIRRYFRIVYSPDLTSARVAVRVGKAEAVFAPISSAGFKPVITHTLRVPPPSFVLLDKTLPPQIVKSATQVVLRLTEGAGPLTGWREADAAAYRRLAQASKKPRIRMVLVPSRLVRPRDSDLVDSEAMKYEYPKVDEIFEVP